MYMGNLAETIAASGIVEAPPKYSVFPWWHALVVESGRERKSADWLQEKAGVTVYLPHYMSKIRRRGNLHIHILRAVVPGLLFVPVEMMLVPRRDKIFEYAHVHGFLRTSDGGPALISKADVEKIREIEATLNLPPPCPAKAKDLHPGDRVRFINETYAAFLGEGVVIAVANDARISVEVSKMFGGRRTIRVAAHEIERMQPKPADVPPPQVKALNGG